MDPFAVLEALLHSLPDSQQQELGKQALECLQKCLSACNDQLDFREILDHLSVSVYVADEHGRTVYVNKTYTEETGIQANEVLGRTVKEIQEDGKLFSGAITDYVRDTKVGVRSLATLLKGNQMTPSIVMGTPILKENGELKCVVSTIWKSPHMKTYLRVNQNSEASGEMLFRKKFGLTMRELEIIDLLFCGHTYQEVADILFISMNTVRTHMRNIYRKTKVGNMGNLLQVYKEYKLVDRDIFP